MTAYIGNKQISHVLYFNRNKNTVITSDLIVDKNYMDTNNRHEYYNDMFVILTDPSIHIADMYYGSLEDVPNFIFYNNTFIFKKQSSYSSTMYHSTKPITRTCNYKIQKISFSSWGTTYYKQWSYTFNGYSFTDSIYYLLIINTIRSKRLKSDCVDSVLKRKGNNLTYLTFDYIKNYQIVFELECFNRTQNVANKSYPMIFLRGTVETTPSKDVIANHPLLFYKNKLKCCLSYCFPTFIYKYKSRFQY